jgi:hypothetical protein
MRSYYSIAQSLSLAQAGGLSDENGHLIVSHVRMAESNYFRKDRRISGVQQGLVSFDQILSTF